MLAEHEILQLQVNHFGDPVQSQHGCEGQAEVSLVEPSTDINFPAGQGARGSSLKRACPLHAEGGGEGGHPAHKDLQLQATLQHIASREAQPMLFLIDWLTK